VVIVASMGGLGPELIEVPALDRLQRVSDPVKLRVARCVVPDSLSGVFLIGIMGFEAGPVALGRESPEIDARLPAGAAAISRTASVLRRRPRTPQIISKSS
jgi:hypothetical protein